MKIVAYLFLIFQAVLVIVVCEAQVAVPVPYSNELKVNSMTTWQARVPQGDPAVLISLPSPAVLQTTDYTDGLGRSLQKVVKKGSSLGNDWVMPFTYDESGREVYKYLPFAANASGGNTSVNDGGFKRNPFQQQSSFYSNTDPDQNPLAGQGETFFYA